MLNKLIDLLRKRKIFKYAMKCGRDVDGDIIVYKGVMYYIHIFNNELKRVPKDKHM